MNYSLQDTGLHIGALVHQNSVTLMHLCTLIQLFNAMHIDRLLYSYDLYKSILPVKIPIIFSFHIFISPKDTFYRKKHLKDNLLIFSYHIFISPQDTSEMY